MRKVLIFGNGLGRALDNDFFDLSAALSDAWNDGEVLTPHDKLLIRQCLPPQVIEEEDQSPPRSESELGNLQRVLAACDEIAKHERSDNEGWLSEHGKRFPHAIRSFIHRSAAYFHAGDHVLPSEFTGPLIDFVAESRSHVATLNYDELLYRSFLGSKLFDGYSCMFDGFVPTFSPDRLERYNPVRQCYYLHLHGSPLYYLDTQGELRKSALRELPQIAGHSSTHLVLTHTDYKPAIINSSQILRTYWQKLYEALQEAEGIVLFGYSGADVHLNNAITVHGKEKQIEIVERNKPEYTTEEGKSARFKFWEDKLGKSPLCYWHNNILDHRNWSYVQPATQ